MARPVRGVDRAVSAGVAWITLRRPRQGNRIDLATAQGLCDAAEEIEHDEAVRVVVLRAEGADFCLGADGGGGWNGRPDCVAAVAALTRPVVAAIGGDAIGEGCELALACDLRVASARAAFALPQIGAGYLPRHGGAQHLARVVGRMRALDWLLTGRRIGAREAERAGLVTRVVAAARLQSAVRRLAADLARSGPLAIRLAKEAVKRGQDMTLEQGIRFEQDLYVLLQTTADRAEGVAAFLAKRRPSYHGR